MATDRGLQVVSSTMSLDVEGSPVNCIEQSWAGSTQENWMWTAQRCVYTWVVLTPLRAQYGATLCKPGKRKPSK